MSEAYLKAIELHKDFGHVQALRGVSVAAYEGEVLAIVGDNGAGVAVEAVLGPVIADVQHHLTGDLGDIHVAVGGDLAHDVDQARGHAGLAGHTAIGILLHDGVQNRIADLVADFVWVTLRHGLTGK